VTEFRLRAVPLASKKGRDCAGFCWIVLDLACSHPIRSLLDRGSAARIWGVVSRNLHQLEECSHVLDRDADASEETTNSTHALFDLGCPEKGNRGATQIGAQVESCNPQTMVCQPGENYTDQH
jgi:hypothetical protein